MENFNIPEAFRPNMIEVAEEMLRKEEKALEEQKAKVAKAREFLEYLTGEGSTEADKQATSDSNEDIKSQREAIRIVLQRGNELLTTGEVYKRVLELAPNLISGDSRRNRVTGISASLSGMHSNGELGRIENPRDQGYLYGKAEWFTDDGLPKEPYVKKAMERGYRLRKVLSSKNRELLSWPES